MAGRLVRFETAGAEPACDTACQSAVHFGIVAISIERGRFGVAEVILPPIPGVLRCVLD